MSRSSNILPQGCCNVRRDQLERVHGLIYQVRFGGSLAINRLADALKLVPTEGTVIGNVDFATALYPASAEIADKKLFSLLSRAT